MNEHGSLKDFSVPLSASQPSTCEGCVLGKQHKASLPVNPNKERCKVPGAFFHVDLCEKMSQPSIKGVLYYLLIKDDCTTYRLIKFIKAKSDALRVFVKVIRLVKRDMKTV